MRDEIIARYPRRRFKEDFPQQYFRGFAHKPAIRQALATHGAAVLNRESAAAYLGISTATLERLTSAGKLRSVKISEGRVGWTRKALDTYLAEQEAR